MVGLSVVITAFNEEKKLEACLESVQDIADEIVVVDCSSADKTAAIAKKYTKHVYTQKNDPLHIDLQKNFGFSKATGDWILSLDADERVTPELGKEIKEVLFSNLNLSNPHLSPLPAGRQGLPQERKEINGYWIPRKNIIFGKWIEHTGWYPDYQLRLFRNGSGKYTEQHVHEFISVEGETVYLTEPMIHLNYETVLQFFLRTATVYAPNEAEALLQKKYKFNYVDAIRMPSREFINRFFGREGYKDGLHGLVLSILMAWYHFMIFAYIWEKKNFKEVNNATFLGEIEEETKKSYKEITYWFFNEKIKQSKNVTEKYLLKLKRKLS